MSGMAQAGAAAGSVSIRPMRRDDAEAVARMHIEQIGQGFLASFSRRTLAAVYRAVTRVPGAFGFVAEANGECRAFIACTADLGKLYRSVIWRRGLGLVVRLLPMLFRPRLIRQVFETLGYPRKAKRMRLPSPEVLSLATCAAYQGRGLGSLLMHAALAEFRRRGCGQVKVLVGGNMSAAQRFYLKQGFRLSATVTHHDIAENVYVIDLSTGPVYRNMAAGG